eukprot:7454564-Pyramimonas_sp.AAC.1
MTDHPARLKPWRRECNAEPSTKIAPENFHPRKTPTNLSWPPWGTSSQGKRRDGEGKQHLAMSSPASSPICLPYQAACMTWRGRSSRLAWRHLGQS